MTVERLISVSPQDPSDQIGEFAVAGPDAVAAAFDASRSAQASWWRGGAAARATALASAARALAGKADEAAALIVREVGKPAGEARGEVARAVAILDFYAQASFGATGAVLPPSLSGLLYEERRPHGVAGLITPWNFPLAIPLWKAAPALAAGNGVVLKPSPDATACAVLLAEVLGQSLPPGLLAIVAGGADTGAAVVASADIVSFTGSAKVGSSIVVDAAHRGIPVQAEMGGQNAAIILPDANVGTTAATVASAAMGFAGQKCTATSRIIVVGDNRPFVDELTRVVDTMQPADPADPGTVVGPLVNGQAFDVMAAAVDMVAVGGGRVLVGGASLDRDGWFVEPTLVDRLAADHVLCQEETFGPLAVIQYADDVHEAIELANGVRFGLVTSVHGRDLDIILNAVDSLDTGLIKVNAPTTGVDFYAPFGGEKASSYGSREQGTAALDFYSSTRTVTIAPHSAA